MSGIRVLGSVTLSFLVLNEPIMSQLEWIGVGITFVTMTFYVFSLHYSESVKINSDGSNDVNTRNTVMDEESNLIEHAQRKKECKSISRQSFEYDSCCKLYDSKANNYKTITR